MQQPTERINKIYMDEYLKLNLMEKVLVDENPVAELGLRFDAMMKYLDEKHEEENKQK